MEQNKDPMAMPINGSDTFAEPSGNTYKGRRELVTDYWCEKKKEARLAGKEYTSTDQEYDVAQAKILYPFEGRYVIDSQGNVEPLKNI